MRINYKKIGQRIANKRKDLRLTQADLAEKVDLSVKHISSVETATSIPSLETLARICRVLDIKTDYVLFGVNKKDENSLIVEIIRHLMISNQKELKEFLKYIKNSKSE